MAPPSQPRLTEIPEQLLEEIFLRIATPADLARAKAACVAFRRFIADRAFLALFRRRHSPPLLGFLDRAGFHPSSPGFFVGGDADFTFSFLPTHCRWTAVDSRDGRVLLAPTPDLVHQRFPPIFTELVVSDPLHRRYVLIPRVPLCISHGVFSGWSAPFLLPPTQEEEEDSTAFRVIWLAHNNGALSGFVFSSRTGQWVEAVARRWEDFGITLYMATTELIQEGPLLRRHYAYGCFYWNFFTAGRIVLIVLDTRIMDFSDHDFMPAGLTMEEMQDAAIVEAGDGRLGLFAMRHDGGMSELRYFIRRDMDERFASWNLVKTIPLGSGRRQSIKAATERFLLLERGINLMQEPPTDTGIFSLNVKTLKLDKVSGLRFNSGGRALIYTNFPPTLLSSPTL